MTGLNDFVSRIRRDVLILYYAQRHPDMPWYAKAVASSVLLYALSPIDLIPDFIPFLGYLDDAVIIPLGIAFAFALIPDKVKEDSRTKAAASSARPISVAGGIIIGAVWVLFVGFLALKGFQWYKKQ